MSTSDLSSRTWLANATVFSNCLPRLVARTRGGTAARRCRSPRALYGGERRRRRRHVQLGGPGRVLLATLTGAKSSSSLGATLPFFGSCAGGSFCCDRPRLFLRDRVRLLRRRRPGVGDRLRRRRPSTAAATPPPCSPAAPADRRAAWARARAPRRCPDRARSACCSRARAVSRILLLQPARLVDVLGRRLRRHLLAPPRRLVVHQRRRVDRVERLDRLGVAVAGDGALGRLHRAARVHLEVARRHVALGVGRVGRELQRVGEVDLGALVVLGEEQLRARAVRLLGLAGDHRRLGEGRLGDDDDERDQRQPADRAEHDQTVLAATAAAWPAQSAATPSATRRRPSAADAARSPTACPPPTPSDTTATAAPRTSAPAAARSTRAARHTPAARRTRRCAIRGRRRRGRRRRRRARDRLIEAHERIAALELIAVVQDHRVDALPVDQRAVARAEVAHAKAPALGVQRKVAPRDRDVGEHQVLIGATADARLGQDQLVGLAAVRSADDVQNSRLRHRDKFTTCYKRYAMRVAYPHGLRSAARQDPRRRPQLPRARRRDEQRAADRAAALLQAADRDHRHRARRSCGRAATGASTSRASSGVVIGKTCRRVARKRRARRTWPATPSSTTSPCATCRRRTASSRAPRASTASARAARASSTTLDPAKLRIVTTLDGVVKQDAPTSDMIFDVATIIEVASRVMTLEPGDLIATGTPSGVGADPARHDRRDHDRRHRHLDQSRRGGEPNEASRSPQRIKELPPYLFADIDKKKAALRAQGKDLIDLGIGDPDLPTPAHIVQAMQQAAAEPRYHRYPSYEGMKEFREAAVAWYQRRFGVDARRGDTSAARSSAPRRASRISRSRSSIRATSCWCPIPAIRCTRPGRASSAARCTTCRSGARTAFCPTSSAIPADVAKRAKMMWINYPNNPTAALATRDFYARVVEFATQARHHRRQRRRLLGDVLRRRAADLVPRDAGRARRSASSSSRCRRPTT